jgi:hypothetical protein
MNIVVHFVGSMYILDLINAWKMEHIKIIILCMLQQMVWQYRFYRLY